MTRKERTTEINDFEIKELVLRCLKNHKNCTSAGIAHLLNIPKFSVLRSLAELIKEGEVRQQRGKTEDGFKDAKWRSYKLAKEMFTTQKLFTDQQLNEL